MALSESTKVNVPLGVAAGLLLTWLLYLTSLVFQVKEDVAVIKTTVIHALGSSPDVARK